MQLDRSAFESIRGRAEEIAEEVAAPKAAEVDAEARWPDEAMTALRQSLGGLVVPVEAGGLGRGLRAVARVCEILGRACSSTAICFGMHCVGTACIAARATPYQQSEWLEPIAAGDHLTSLAMSEPGTGSHFYFPQAELREREEGYLLRGTKSFVTNGNCADSYVVSTAASDRHRVGEFSLVVVPSGSQGVEWADRWRGIGMRGNESMTLAGGRGFAENSRLGRLLRDARAADVMAPTTQMLETWIGRGLLGQPLLSD